MCVLHQNAEAPIFIYYQEMFPTTFALTTFFVVERSPESSPFADPLFCQILLIHQRLRDISLNAAIYCQILLIYQRLSDISLNATIFSTFLLRSGYSSVSFVKRSLKLNPLKMIL